MKQGITFIETIMISCILAVITAIVVPNFTLAKNTAEAEKLGITIEEYLEKLETEPKKIVKKRLPEIPKSEFRKLYGERR